MSASPPLPLAAGAILMPMLHGAYASFSETSASWLTVIVLLLASAGVIAPSRWPAVSWQVSVRQPNIFVLGAIAAIIGVLEHNVWSAIGWLPPVYVAMAAIGALAHAAQPQLPQPPSSPAHRKTGRVVGHFAILLACALPFAPLAWPHQQHHAIAQPAALAQETTESSAPAPPPAASPSPAAIRVGFTGPLGSERLPAPWRLFHNPLVLGGRTEATALPDPSEPGAWIIRLATARSSFAIDMNCNPDPAIHWDLAWQWRAETLPTHGDIRDANRADCAIQVGVYFDTKPWDPAKPDLTPDGYSLLYSWDAAAPEHTVATRDFTFGTFHYEYKVHVLRTGEPTTDGWCSERRNLHDDFVSAYGFEPPPIRGVRIQSASSHTKTKSAGQVRSVWILPPDAPKS